MRPARGDEGGLLKLFFIAVILCSLCSCTSRFHSPLQPRWWETHPPEFDPEDANWEKHPPKVREIIPPQWDEHVRIILYPEFSPSCFLEEAQAERIGEVVSKYGVEKLAQLQDVTLSRTAGLKRTVVSSTSGLVVDWNGALSAFSVSARERWQERSRDAYRAIVRNVLNNAQREEYRRLESLGRSDRDDIWCWLFPTDEQRREILCVYARGLQESQDAWVISLTLATSNHRTVDRVLAGIQRHITTIDAVRSAYQRISDDVATADKKLRHAQRELEWSGVHLKTEVDPKKEIRLRKQIIDKKVETQQLQIAAQRQSRLLALHTWRMKELAQCKVTMSLLLSSLQQLHAEHRRIEQAASHLRGKVSSKCDREYGALRAALLSGFSVARRHRSCLSSSAQQVVDRALRRGE